MSHCLSPPHQSGTTFRADNATGGSSRAMAFRKSCSLERSKTAHQRHGGFPCKRFLHSLCSVEMTISRVIRKASRSPEVPRGNGEREPVPAQLPSSHCGAAGPAARAGGAPAPQESPSSAPDTCRLHRRCHLSHCLGSPHQSGTPLQANNAMGGSSRAMPLRKSCGQCR